MKTVVIGVYPQAAKFFPIGMAMHKALTMRAADCSHRKYVPRLMRIIQEGKFYPSQVLTKTDGLADAIACYKHFDRREPGWIKIDLLPGQKPQAAA